MQFRFDKLCIRGFRGIRELDLDIPVKKPLHLIGGNNSGKTTIIEALALVLGGGGFHQFTPEQFDFFHSHTGEAATDFTVTLNFHADDETGMPAVQGVGSPIRVHAIEVRGTTDTSGRFSHRWVLLNGNGDHILLSDKTPLKGTAKEEFKGMGLGYRQFYARLNHIRAYMPDVCNPPVKAVLRFG